MDQNGVEKNISQIEPNFMSHINKDVKISFLSKRNTLNGTVWTKLLNQKKTYSVLVKSIQINAVEGYHDFSKEANTSNK